jgi:CubicO group peptidase (beta-lactamase class C family)
MMADDQPQPRLPRVPVQFIPPDAETAAAFPRHDRPDDAPERCAGPCPPQQVCDACQYPDDAPERDAEAVAATPAAAAPDSGADETPQQRPDPLFAGTYAIYDDGHGGYVLVAKTREGQEHRKHLPAGMVKMAQKLSSAGPLASLFGG